jgi:hypothetical protein
MGYSRRMVVFCVGHSCRSMDATDSLSQTWPGGRSVGVGCGRGIEHALGGEVEVKS